MRPGKTRMTVGVVIPTYNSAQVVTEAIDSILSQEPPPDQLIVVDDGSMDDTPSILERYQGRLEYIRQSNRGPAAARNMGWRRLKTDAVVFLDADDILLPGALGIRLALLAHGRAMWGYTEGFLQDASGACSSFSKTYPPPTDADGRSIFPTLLCRNFITASALIVQRDALESVKGLDESISGTEDWDLSLRLAVGYPVGYDPQPTFVQRLGPNTHSRDRDRMDRMRYHTLVKTYRLYPNQVAVSGPSARRSVADAHNGIGIALAREGRWGEAQPYLWTSIKLWPRQRRAWVMLFRSLLLHRR